MLLPFVGLRRPFYIASYRPLSSQKIQDRLIQINFEPTWVLYVGTRGARVRTPLVHTYTHWEAGGTRASWYARESAAARRRASIGSNDLPRSKCNDTFPLEHLAGPVLPLSSSRTAELRTRTSTDAGDPREIRGKRRGTFGSSELGHVL